MLGKLLVVEVHRISPRVMAVRLLITDCDNKNIGLFIVSAYAPIGVASETEWSNFFDEIDVCISKKLVNDIVIIGSDTNSSMGCFDRTDKDTTFCLGKFGLPYVNDSGKRFASHLAINDLLAITTCFQKHNYATWIHPRSKLKHQIDHFLVIKEHFKYIMDAGVTQSLLDSDHSAIMCKIRLISRLKKKSSPREKLLRLDYSQLKNDVERENFCTNVLQSYNVEPEHNNVYTKLANSITSVCHNTLSKRKKPSPGWFISAQDKLIPLIEKRNQAMSQKFKRPLRSTYNKLKSARKMLKRTICKSKNDWIISKCRELNKPSNTGTKLFWDSVNQLKAGLCKTKTSNERSMKKPDGTFCKNPEENATVFQEHFKSLYGRQPSFDASVLDLLDRKEEVLDLDHPPDDEEIIKATRRLKEKAPGDSGIPPLIWKSLIENEETFQLLKDVILEFWHSEKPPSEWEKVLLKVLPKKGDLSMPGNYRGIMLLESAYKIVAIIIHDRLRPIAENLDHEAQCGFRPGRGCVDGIFTVKMAMKKRREHGLESWILFLDLVKAFDRVPRELLWEVLGILGVPAKIVRLLKSLHANVEVKFVINDVTKSIESIIGVKQGDILGPLLFIFYLAAVMISWRKTYDRPVCIFNTKFDDVLTGRRYNTKRGVEEFSLPDSEYADDTAVLFTTRTSAKFFIPLLLNHFARFGLEVHVGTGEKPSKSEVLFVAAPDSVYNDPSSFDGCDLSNIILPDGSFLPIVDRFCYRLNPNQRL